MVNKKNKSLKKYMVEILRAIKAGDKTTSELSWMGEISWQGAYLRAKELEEYGLLEKIIEEEKVYWRLTDKGVRKLQDYPI